jgi:hypothetical protein
MTATTILINRAPVLTLWAAVVAERLGFKHDEALSLEKALAGLMHRAKASGWAFSTPARRDSRRCTSASRVKNSGSRFLDERCRR